MRHGQLDNEDKARSVLTRTGRPGNEVAALSDAERDELAAIYDQCIAPETGLAAAVAEFWGQRQQRLDAGKATSDAVTPVVKRFRNAPRMGGAGKTDSVQPAAKDSVQPAAKDTVQPAAKDTVQPAAKDTVQPAVERPADEAPAGEPAAVTGP